MNNSTLIDILDAGKYYRRGTWVINGATVTDDAANDKLTLDIEVGFETQANDLSLQTGTKILNLNEGTGIQINTVTDTLTGKTTYEIINNDPGSAAADNLGNHIATQDLEMNGGGSTNNITNCAGISNNLFSAGHRYINLEDVGNIRINTPTANSLVLSNNNVDKITISSTTVTISQELNMSQANIKNINALMDGAGGSPSASDNYIDFTGASSSFIFNAATGQTMRFRNNNVEKLRIESNLIVAQADLNLSDNDLLSTNLVSSAGATTGTRINLNTNLNLITQNTSEYVAALIGGTLSYTFAQKSFTFESATANTASTAITTKGSLFQVDTGSANDLYYYDGGAAVLVT